MKHLYYDVAFISTEPKFLQRTQTTEDGKSNMFNIVIHNDTSTLRAKLSYSKKNVDRMLDS